MKFCKTRDVKSPTRANVTDAGIDFYIPNDFKKTKFYPGQDVLIPSGIKLEIPKGCMGLFLNKSGVCSKKKIVVGAQVVDEGYTGEVHLHLINTSDDQVEVNPGDKIVQMILVPVNYEQLEIVDESDLFQQVSSERGSGGFGSTGSI